MLFQEYNLNLLSGNNFVGKVDSLDVWDSTITPVRFF